MSAEPWYRTTLRWAQTNLVESDPARYDAEWWREHWRKTRIQGVIVNAGGIVAYYPSPLPAAPPRREARRPRPLRRDRRGRPRGGADGPGPHGLEPGRARTSTRRIPTGSAATSTASPIRQADKFVTCIGSPYYSEYLPDVMREIIERSQPDGFTDNSWAGPAAHQHLLLRPLQDAVPGLRRQGAAAVARLGRRRLPRLGALELPAPDRPLEVQQPGHPRGRRRALRLDGDDRRRAPLQLEPLHRPARRSCPRPRSSCSTTSGATPTTASSRTPRPASGCTRSRAGTS